LDHLHAAQNEFYGGGSDAGLREILNSEIVWTVPGTNLIAGVYRGLDAVLDYFRGAVTWRPNVSDAPP